MSFSSGRAQAEPLVALVCVAVLCTALAGYATAYDHSLPTADRDLAPSALDAATDVLLVQGVAQLDRLDDARPDISRPVNVTLSAGGRTWSVGPQPPAEADAASRPVAVRVASGDVLFGRLRVVVW
ncbi:hypothetical protein [Salarchaeum sp. JOR-1]|uniref:DUF7285 family protein n=1 Tax=Salarchaeum sp. JOR-1 TaxID=2599399 RepID=UPI0011984558|nr:hypothetical protein [Salarchaeum sp. JOR-1]QDX39794.1 hypothetical protein FQU85_02355 [Salarchaeum sp. JOR-1]